MAGGRSRAKAGVMRRLSMVALRCTARQLLRGLAIVGPSCIHQRNALRPLAAPTSTPSARTVGRRGGTPPTAAEGPPAVPARAPSPATRGL